MPAEPAVRDDSSRKLQSRQGDGRIARLAARQHGVVSRAQLREIGLSDRVVNYRLRLGRLHQLHRGVYAVGHRAVSRHGCWMAAVLACGDQAVLSHRTAATLWGLRTGADRQAEVVVAREMRSRPRIRVRQRALPPDEVTVRDGIPVTNVPRTLFDLAAVLPPRQLERAIEEAEVRRLGAPLSLAHLVARYPGRRGVAALRAILAAGRIGSSVTRSELEERFLSLLDDCGLPRPEVNASLRVRGRWIECDCLWRARRLVVELDGHAFHSTRAAYERDRARDRALLTSGWRVVRVTWRQLCETPRELVDDLRRLFAPASGALTGGGSGAAGSPG